MRCTICCRRGRSGAEGSVGLRQGRGVEQAAAAEFGAKVGGQAAARGIGNRRAAPGVAQMAGKRQQTQRQADAHEKLQAEFEHGRAPHGVGSG